MAIVDFSGGYDEITISPLTQFDKGQVLQIYGLTLPDVVQVHFATKPLAYAILGLATKKDGYSEVKIPNLLLASAHTIYAYIYLSGENADGETTGKTIKKIVIPVNARTKPEDYASEEEESNAINTILTYYESLKATADEIAGTVDEYRKFNYIRFVTKAEYEALTVKETDVVYVFTDDTTYEDLEAAKAKLADYEHNVKPLKQDSLEAIKALGSFKFSSDGEGLSVIPPVKATAYIQVLELVGESWLDGYDEYRYISGELSGRFFTYEGETGIRATVGSILVPRGGVIAGKSGGGGFYVDTTLEGTESVPLPHKKLIWSGEEVLGQEYSDNQDLYIAEIYDQLNVGDRIEIRCYQDVDFGSLLGGVTRRYYSIEGFVSYVLNTSDAMKSINTYNSSHNEIFTLSVIAWKDSGLKLSALSPKEEVEDFSITITAIYKIVG